MKSEAPAPNTSVSWLPTKIMAVPGWSSQRTRTMVTWMAMSACKSLGKFGKGVKDLVGSFGYHPHTTLFKHIQTNLAAAIFVMAHCAVRSKGHAPPRSQEPRSNPNYHLQSLSLDWGTCKHPFAGRNRSCKSQQTFGLAYPCGGMRALSPLFCFVGKAIRFFPPIFCFFICLEDYL